jgi:peptidoglycan/xylan/chitin deacetylase (PgdA/CDA1 family)
MYHQVLEQPDPYTCFGIHLSMFEAQLALLSRFCSVLPLDEIMDRIERGHPLPARCVALTFDDGYRDMYTRAVPLLKRYNLPAILYVAVQAIERGFVWLDLLRYVIRTTHELRVELDTLQDGEPRIVSFATLSERVRAARQLNVRLKQLQSGDKRRVLDELVWKLLGRSPHDVTIPGLMLSWDQLRSMARDGVEIGAHTMTHPILTRIPEQEAKDEITTSRRKLEQALGVPVRHFAYPNGQPADFSPAVRRLVEEAGFRSACTTVQGFNRPSDDRLILKRIDGNQDTLHRLVRIMADRAS